ncbi:4Fe-4S dicluster domain-containing protein [Berryella wangjianweii]|uniref:4Fe-4S dicluster domain-containing protein n=1 Tax=Berryella wangjianweii TaxID=2734634 RepID=A0A6M8J8S8_9ACTN|nr:4Fe-4S dicluster domain-containing protein [Berryella wangjianweii]QKF07242.1 4Fe-4S dicluster domain-containing protein [Berryella wangjianweii]
MSGVAIYYDASRCTACKGCQVACKTWNELPSPLEKNSQEWSGSLQNPPDLNGNTRLVMTFREADNDTKWGIDWAFGRRSCMHCGEPACVIACPTGCLQKDEDTGFVVLDTDKCIGCQYCRSACPFDVPRHTGVGLDGMGITINKCTGCVDRVRHDRSPACVTACQPEALDFGPRDEMIAKAEARVATLHERGFDKARVYGKDEVGGCHTIHVLKYGLEMYELPENPQVPEFTRAEDGVMKVLTGVGAAGVVAGLGLSFLTGVGYHRDEQRYDEKTGDIIDVDTGEVVRHIDKEAGER